jgi:NAD(P)-dependent dehydrogenase (short-subunit alcohol dehydrogenase family)
MDVTDTVTLITGANRGVGRELASQLADLGHTVVLAAREADAARRTADALVALEPRRRLLTITLDVTDQASVNAAADEVARTLGRLDVLVNNAGGYFDTEHTAADADLAVAARAFDTNVLGAWRVTQAMLPALRRSSSPRVVNVSSQKACLTEMDGSTPAYRTSKAALNAVTRMLAADLGPDGVSVYGASPGWTATDLGGEHGRPVAEGAASIRWVIEQPSLPVGRVYQDGLELPC